IVLGPKSRAAAEVVTNASAGPAQGTKTNPSAQPRRKPPPRSLEGRRDRRASGLSIHVPSRGTRSVAAKRNRRPIETSRSRSFGSPSASRIQLAKRIETKKQVASPAMIAYGRRRLPPTPLPSTIGRTGKTHGEIAVISPATKASGIATTTIRPLFGRVCLLGCYSVLIFG